MPTYEGILEKMKNMEMMTPPEVVFSYSYLAAVMAEKSLELAECMAEMARSEARFLAVGDTAASAKVKAQATPEGLRLLKLKAGLKGTEELVRCLKKAQSFYSDEAKNLY